MSERNDKNINVEKEAYECMTPFEIDLLEKGEFILRNVATSYYDNKLHIKMAIIDPDTLESKREFWIKPDLDSKIKKTINKILGYVKLKVK